MMTRSLMADPNNSRGRPNRHTRWIGACAPSSAPQSRDELPVQPPLEPSGQPRACRDGPPPHDGPSVARVEQARRTDARRRDSAMRGAEVSFDFALEDL